MLREKKSWMLHSYLWNKNIHRVCIVCVRVEKALCCKRMERITGLMCKRSDIYICVDCLQTFFLILLLRYRSPRCMHGKQWLLCTTSYGCMNHECFSKYATMQLQSMCIHLSSTFNVHYPLTMRCILDKCKQITDKYCKHLNLIFQVIRISRIFIMIFRPQIWIVLRI